MPHQNAESDSEYYSRTLTQFSPPCWTNHKKDQTHSDYFRMLWDMEWVERDKDELIAAADDKVTLGGNEPHSVKQSSTTPESFYNAVVYWKEHIKRPLAVPGILWGPSGKSWWEEYQKFSPPKPDAYHIHIYAYDGPHWTHQFYEALNTFGDRPLIISEAGGWGVVPDVQKEIMSDIYTVIALNRCPSVFWFSSKYGPYAPYWCATDCQTRSEHVTQVGVGYKKYANKESYMVSLPVIMG